MSLYPPPQIVESEVWTSLPERFRRPGGASDWITANRMGAAVDSFLEGPSFDREGNLWVTDIPFGRVFRISPAGEWTLACEYEGWPNGLKFHRDGMAYIADYKLGIVRLNPRSGAVETLLTNRYSEGFRGCNDLFFDRAGRLYFTDQGQSGMHMPNGRVYRYDFAADRLELLIDTGQSPNGLVTNASEDLLYVAMTRGNSVWRLVLMPDGGVSKVGVFLQLSGGLAGPDGLALDAGGGLWVAHAGNGSVWGFSPLGEPLYRVRSPAGLLTTNLAFGGPDGRSLFITESASGSILRVELPVAGRALFAQS